MMVRARAIALAAIMSLGLVTPLLAQQTGPTSSPGAGLSVSGVTLQTRGTAVLVGNREVITGSWAGVAAELRLGLLVLEGLGARGTMTAAESTFALDRDGGEMRGLLRLEPAPWLWLEGGYTIRAFDSPAGYQRWDIPAVGVGFAPDALQLSIGLRAGR